MPKSWNRSQKYEAWSLSSIPPSDSASQAVVDLCRCLHSPFFSFLKHSNSPTLYCCGQMSKRLPRYLNEYIAVGGPRRLFCNCVEEHADLFTAKQICSIYLGWSSCVQRPLLPVLRSEPGGPSSWKLFHLVSCSIGNTAHTNNCPNSVQLLSSVPS